MGAGVVAGILAVTAALESWAPEMYGAAALLGKIASYAVLLGAGVAAAATLYRRVVPDITPGWRAVLPGALLAGIGWVLFTLGFGIYVANFGNYNATYGSLGAVVVLLTWLYLVAYVLLLGAELNAVRPERARSCVPFRSGARKVRAAFRRFLRSGARSHGQHRAWDRQHSHQRRRRAHSRP